MEKQNKLKKHEETYWHIPKIAILPILGFILFTLLAIGNYQLINKEVISNVFNCNVDAQDICDRLVLSDLINSYPIIGEYILICLVLISLVASFKRGYKNLKSYEEEGLIAGLIFGLIGGLIAGLIAGLIFGLIGGLIFGLIAGLIFGLIAGLIAGLIGGEMK